MGENPYLIAGPALISFSGGRTSGYMLKHILDAHGGTLPADVHVAFANTGREMPETLDFVQECSERWNVPVTWLEFDPNAEHRTRLVNHNSASRDGEPFSALIDGKKMLPNPLVRYCTIELKIRRMREFCVHWLGWKNWKSIVGLRADEPRRIAKLPARNAAKKDRWTTVAPIAEAGGGKTDVHRFWAEQSFDLGLAIDEQGETPLGNCDCCYLKSRKKIERIIKADPRSAEWWIKQEQRGIGEGRAAFFRADRPSYAEMLDASGRQGDLFEPQEESLDCACTD